MKILLLGATGGVGKHFLQFALERGDEVTALVRNPEKITFSHPQLTVVQGDVFQLNDVKKVMGGQEAVVSCLNTSKSIHESDELQRMIGNCVEAMQESDVQHIVYCASAGVENEIPGEKGKEVMHFLRHPLYDHAQAIQKIRNAGLQYTIARPGGLMNEDHTGKYLEAETGIPASTNRINRADVADFMLKALHDKNYLGKSIGLSN